LGTHHTSFASGFCIFFVVGYTDEFNSQFLSGINGHVWNGEVVSWPYQSTSGSMTSTAAIWLRGKIYAVPMTYGRPVLCRSTSNVKRLTLPLKALDNAVNWNLEGRQHSPPGAPQYRWLWTNQQSPCVCGKKGSTIVLFIMAYTLARCNSSDGKFAFTKETKQANMFFSQPTLACQRGLIYTL